MRPPRLLRLWPGVIIVALQWLVWLGAPLALPGLTAAYVSVLGGFLGGLAVVVWWAFFSRAPRLERWGAVGLMIAALFGAAQILHKSIAAGMMGMMFPIYVIPVLSLAFVLWAVATRNLSDGLRRATMAATILLACGGWALLRISGIDGDGSPDFAWRWTETPEERLLAQASDEPTESEPPPASETPETSQPTRQTDDEAAQVDEPTPSATPTAPETAQEEAAQEPAETRAAWPGFRGPARDGVVPGVRIATDWSAAPPEELWRRPIGPGWSSFAVSGDVFYTQEQRGEDEIVAAYDLATGEPVWKHRDETRFWEANAGAGPRGTPTFAEGRVYAFGATGILNALDAEDGSVLWSRDVASDTDVEVPTWGFSSSPWVTEDLVLVAAAGRLAAYDRATGDLRWRGPEGGSGYSSPHLLTIDGVEQLVLLHGAGAMGFAPADGTLLWEHEWPEGGIVQPALAADGDVLIGSGLGVRRVGVGPGSDGWTVEERWTSRGLKPYFNDFVVHEGHAYGFDGGILSCIDLADDGQRQWKGGRYGHGQLVLLPEQDVLLVLSEKGELALVRATPDQFIELARMPAIEGKTWNHPVLVDDVLLARNGREMVAFRLARADG